MGRRWHCGRACEPNAGTGSTQLPLHAPQLRAPNKQTGKELWKFLIALPIRSSPVVSGNLYAFGKG